MCMEKTIVNCSVKYAGRAVVRIAMPDSLCYVGIKKNAHTDVTSIK